MLWQLRRMTKRALVNQGDLMRMAAVAKKTGMRVEVEIDGVIIRVAPDYPEMQKLQQQVKKERIRL
jgi:uncharacterized protein YhdP